MAASDVSMAALQGQGLKEPAVASGSDQEAEGTRTPSSTSCAEGRADARDVESPTCLPAGVHVFHSDSAGDIYCASPAEAEFLHAKIFEEDEYGTIFGEKGLQPSSGVVIDVGANIGMFAKYAITRLSCPEVWCFEPMPPLVECLRRNVRPGQDRIFQVAVSEEPAPSITLDYLPNYTLLSGIGASANCDKYKKAERDMSSPKAQGLTDESIEAAFAAQKVEAEVVTLEQACQPLVEAGRHISVLKVDCEFMEEAVIRGIKSKALWDLIDSVVMEVHDQGSRIEDLTKLLESHGYRVSVSPKSVPCFLLGEGAQAEDLQVCLMVGVRQ